MTLWSFACNKEDFCICNKSEHQGTLLHGVTVYVMLIIIIMIVDITLAYYIRSL